MYIVNVDGSGLVDLSSVGEGWQVDWSPDGGSILFTSHRDHPDNLPGRPYQAVCPATSTLVGGTP
jgi:hypothetical protein